MSPQPVCHDKKNCGTSSATVSTTKELLQTKKIKQRPRRQSKEKKTLVPALSSTTSGGVTTDYQLDSTQCWFFLKNEIDFCIFGRYIVWVLLCYYYIVLAYKIRILSILKYGTVIHGFDPYFQYRATEYLQHKSWYPLGRPVGTTIYPGVQFTAVGIHKLLNFFTFALSSFLDPSCRLHHVAAAAGEELGRGGASVGGTGGETMPAAIQQLLVGGTAQQHHNTEESNTTTKPLPSSCILVPISLNDVCCYIPVWFGVMASIVAGFIAYECSLDWCCDGRTKEVGSLLEYFGSMKISKALRRRLRALYGTRGHKINDKQKQQTKEIHHNPSVECAIFTIGAMGICPASLTRSMGGVFDNDSIAILPMMLTMYFWVRSLRRRDEKSYRYGYFTGLMFFYLASCWAGYIFVLNLIALHAFWLVLIGRYTNKLYYSYSLFYLIGILSSMQLPIIGMAPLRSLDQIGGLVVFMVFQGIQFCECRVKAKNLQGGEAKKYRMKFGAFTVSASLAFVLLFMPRSYFGPLNPRIVRIFFQDSKGSPLVDSLAEHGPTNSFAYYRCLHYLCFGAPLGLTVVCFHFGDAPSFLLTYAVVASFLSQRMFRLIFLLGPIASILSGIALGRLVSHVLYKLSELDLDEEERLRKSELLNAASTLNSTAATSRTNKKKKSGKKKHLRPDDDDSITSTIKTVVYFSILSVFVIFSSKYQRHCVNISRNLSDPSVIQWTQSKDGKMVKIDDYREAYWWLRDNTAEDARILACWDYGYQITAIANRTTIADGNTWNYEHIALLGRVLTSSEEVGYNIARHLADYILVWAGGDGDDLAKSTHIATIADHVYGSICPGEDLDCSEFGFIDDSKRSPSGKMSQSLIYKLHSHNRVNGVTATPNFFKEVYESKHGKVRIFQILNIDMSSKSWVADPKNKVCDVLGGWLCRGQFPPALQRILTSEKVSFQDNNRSSNNDNNGGGGDDEEDTSSRKSLESALNHPENEKTNDRQMLIKPKDMEIHVHDDLIGKEVTVEAIEELGKSWQDTPYTTVMWKVITQGNVEDLRSWLEMAPLLAFVRSADGRGPMFWAFEHRKHEMVHMLVKYGLGHS
eukprot:CAMPEP_0176492986 /NCGR_PEP_ID=MMETSP0200_2-20121128/9311_1 /TAXON_ID=947934 /ORGANISM="Chaetoceros sp., Strain GSL56" /LENGTH=1087 /DNA_ID=CAMNT_0017890625 /DNA_START=48 /DNA_END=3308 /DNA_ORIENTATION=-